MWNMAVNNISYPIYQLSTLVLSTSAKHLKVLKVASAVIRLKSETIVDANTRISYMITSLNIIIP